MTEGTVPFDEAQTWYRVTGELRPGDAGAPAPLVVLHGGPGAAHDYLLSIADLADGRAVVHYDQIGNGRSNVALRLLRCGGRRRSLNCRSD